MRRTNHQLNPHFVRAIRASDLPGHRLAQLAGFKHHSRFSNLLHAPTVPGSTAPLFRRVAEYVEFPPEQIFVSECLAEPPRLVKRVKHVGAPLAEVAE